ncbi:unnamed protein product [Prorocentrum cordatum]|uniref:Uncharacterized protein n=1 Tax=Prorocentrum cordatum TaxID=2364126 RepID=A0ABN9XL41_9DINO|nr:unnamed protein product [Polarella glacialis]
MFCSRHLMVFNKQLEHGRNVQNVPRYMLLPHRRLEMHSNKHGLEVLPRPWKTKQFKVKFIIYSPNTYNFPAAPRLQEPGRSTLAIMQFNMGGAQSSRSMAACHCVHNLQDQEPSKCVKITGRLVYYAWSTNSWPASYYNVYNRQGQKTG